MLPQKTANPRLKFVAFNRGLAFGNIGIYHWLGLPFLVEEVVCFFLVSIRYHRFFFFAIRKITERKGKKLEISCIDKAKPVVI